MSLLRLVPYFANMNAAPVKVRHADLKRFGKGDWKSVCPVCDAGILLGPPRNSEWRMYTRTDRCTRCAQLVHYTDETINGEGFLDGPTGSN